MADCAATLRPFLTAVGLPPLPDGWLAGIRRLHADVAAANRRLNLTRITDFDDFVIKHVADSLLGAAALPSLATTAWRVADVGCGAGFPGLPLALTFPRLRVTEIDSARKKSAYTAELVGRLQLSSVRVVRGRARELGCCPEHAGAYDVVCARAVSSGDKLIRECRRLLAAGGVLLVYQTPATVVRDRRLVEREAAKAGLRPSLSPVYTLPGRAGQRQLWMIRDVRGAGRHD